MRKIYKYNYVAENQSLKERSSSLKPKKLEMKEYNNFQEPKGSNQPFFSFNDKTVPDNKLNLNQSYNYPPKPPKKEISRKYYVKVKYRPN